MRGGGGVAVLGQNDVVLNYYYIIIYTCVFNTWENSTDVCFVPDIFILHIKQ